jgi:FtsZ-interacting cell division protein ZipA
VDQFELKDLFQNLANDEFRPVLIIAAIAILLIILLIVYLLVRSRGKRAIVVDKMPVDLRKAPENETRADSPKAPAREMRVDSPKTPANAMRMDAPRASVARRPRHSIPEDSVLRRHHINHIKYMIETTTFPRPTDSVLRRHYDHLIASELEACLGNEAVMDRLISRYEEHRRNARS